MNTANMETVTGRIACALQIVNDFPYESISEQKSRSVLPINVNVMDKSRAPQDSDSEEALAWQLLQRQSRSYYELEQLVRAIEALAMWVSHERPHTTAPKRSSSAPSALKKAKAHMDESIAPLLNPGILLHAHDEQEQHYFDQIRTAYLPELIIAYNTALYTAGPTITRDAYLESMDLSVALAASEANGLADTIASAGRMRELVKTFAEASKMMLVMKASGRPRKPGKGGRDLGLWEIGPQGAGAEVGIADAADEP
jgi:nuclear pore complex protein Nup107